MASPKGLYGSQRAPLLAAGAAPRSIGAVCFAAVAVVPTADCSGCMAGRIFATPGMADA